MFTLPLGDFLSILGHSETFGAYSCCEQPHDFTRVLVQTVAEQGELEVPGIRPIPGLCPPNMCILQFGHFKCFLGHSETFGAYSCCEQPHDFTRVLLQTVAEQGDLEVPEI